VLLSAVSILNDCLVQALPRSIREFVFLLAANASTLVSEACLVPGTLAAAEH
jgi:hypothetical protein